MKTNELIKMRRLEKGLTMREVAERVGVSEATVSRWESGDIQNMKRANIEKLSRVIDVPPTVLLDWDAYDEERIRRNQLVSELSALASTAKIEHIEIVLKLLKSLEALE